MFALLSLFWETTLLLDVDKWLFVEFLYVIAGPMVLLFASSVIIAPSHDEQGGENHSHYIELSGRFFFMLALHEIWILGLDYWFASFNLISVINAAMLCLLLVLTFSNNIRIHVIGASLAWACYIAALVLRTL